MCWGWNTTGQKVYHTDQMVRNRPKTTESSVYKVKDAQQEDILYRWELELQQDCKVILKEVQQERGQQMKRSEATA